MYIIAHISDLHISYTDENGNGKRLIELLKDIEKRNCDHLIITGDLVENPDARDFHFVKGILAHFDFIESDKLTVIPGNHDIFGGAVKGIEGLYFSTVCKNTDYESNVELFAEIYKGSFPEKLTYPNVKIINNIALIGINSIDKWSEDMNPEGSNGKITEEDYEKLDQIFSSEELKDKYKIVLMHHHLNKEKLRDDMPKHSLWLKVISYKMKLHKRKKFIEYLKKHKVNLVLHGHTHISEVYNIKGVSVVNSSAGAIPLTDEQIRKYNLINVPGLNDEEKIIKIETITL